MKDAPSPESLCAFDGIVGTWLLGSAIVFFKGPEWDSVVIKPVEQANGSYYAIVVGYSLLALSYWVCSVANHPTLLNCYLLCTGTSALILLHS
jgi:hypothetical protein